jgi:micrococcal nuclease
MFHQSLIAADNLPSNTLAAPVLKVCDGDGFHTKITPMPGMELNAILRFAYIDAPELSQKGGPEAKKFLQSLIGGKSVEIALLHKLNSGKCVDKYGRIIGTPYLSEFVQIAAEPKSNLLRKVFGTRKTVVRNIELEMLLNGWAWVLDIDKPAKKYLDAQEEARRCRRGIWAYDSNLTPWAYKKQVKAGRTPEARFLSKNPTPISKPVQHVCPKDECGGHLKRRNGKHGKFWGCTNYPKCNYTRNQ